MNKVEKYIEATWDSNYRFKTEDIDILKRELSKKD